MVDVAEAMLAVKRLDDARELVRTAEELARGRRDADQHAEVLTAVGTAAALSGRDDLAQRLLDSVPDHGRQYRAMARCEIAAALAAGGWIDEAARLARADTSSYAQREALTRVAVAAVTTGHPTVAIQLLGELPRGYDTPADATRRVAIALADAGQLDRAEQLARGVAERGERVHALSVVARRSAAAGQLDRAARLVALRRRPDRFHVVRLVVGPALHVRRSRGGRAGRAGHGARGDRPARPRPDGAWIKPSTAREKCPRRTGGTAAWPRSAGRWPPSGSIDRAVDLAATLVRRDIVNWSAAALRQIAGAVATTGDPERAVRLAEGISALPYRVEAIAEVATTFVARGHRIRAEELARTLDYLDRKERTLAVIARRLLSPGSAGDGGRPAGPESGRDQGRRIVCELLTGDSWFRATPALALLAPASIAPIAEAVLAL